jgi:hypothetical protein
MVNVFNLHLSKKQHFPTGVERTSKIYNLMVSKGDIEAPKRLQRPTHGLFEEISLSRFLESRIIPTSLYDATLMATGDWYYTRYKSWFDDFLWQVFQLCRRSSIGRKKGVPCEAILDEQPGAYFFLAQLDAYRDYKDDCVRSNLNHLFAQGHIAPFLFVLNYAESVFEQRHRDTGEPRRDDHRSMLGGTSLSDEMLFRTKVLEIAYAAFKTDSTETVVRDWNARVLHYAKKVQH